MKEIYNYQQNTKSHYLSMIIWLCIGIFSSMVVLYIIIFQQKALKFWWITPVLIFSIIVMYYMILYTMPLQFIIYDNNNILLPVNLLLFKFGIRRIVSKNDIKHVEMGKTTFFFTLKKGKYNYIDYLPGSNFLQMRKSDFDNNHKLNKEKKKIRNLLSEVEIIKKNY
ncbi:MAG: hypothetical protein GF411_12845 [Candidatus Lokiarchaeota archaeon]|nr:hypothetical protein [Candidatus Lokiarchaeota archaeon]